MFTHATILAVLLCLGAAQQDETLVEKAVGRDVVEATISSIEAHCIFKENHLFVRRLAYVESKDGMDEDTFEEGFYGGIWQIKEGFFNTTKKETKLINEVKAKIGIDWTSVQWEDLLKPYYSGLAAYMYIAYLDEVAKIHIPYYIRDQADIWHKDFDHNDDKGKFIARAEDDLQKSLCNGDAADIVFVIDGSYSKTDFALVKRFLEAFLSEYVFEWDKELKAKFSLIEFDDIVKVHFNFAAHKKREEYWKALKSLSPVRHGLKTHLTLDYVAESGFTAGEGARPSGVPRIVIVLTDGFSANPFLTAKSAKKLHEKDIKVFAVGVGNHLNEKELEAIASSPKCSYVKYLPNDDVMYSIITDIVARSCKATKPTPPTEFVTKTNTTITTITATTPETTITNTTPETNKHGSTKTNTTITSALYDCNENDPCTAENLALRRLYWPHQELGKYIQCSEEKGCEIRPTYF